MDRLYVRGVVGEGNCESKTKGQQLKGKIVSEIFTHFHNFSHFFIVFPQGLSLAKQRALAQGEQKRRKDNKKNRTNRCCTLVVARLSSSYNCESKTVSRQWGDNFCRETSRSLAGPSGKWGIHRRAVHEIGQFSPFRPFYSVVSTPKTV